MDNRDENERQSGYGGLSFSRGRAPLWGGATLHPKIYNIFFMTLGY